MAVSSDVGTTYSQCCLRIAALSNAVPADIYEPSLPSHAILRHLVTLTSAGCPLPSGGSTPKEAKNGHSRASDTKSQSAKSPSAAPRANSAGLNDAINGKAVCNSKTSSSRNSLLTEELSCVRQLAADRLEDLKERLLAIVQALPAVDDDNDSSQLHDQEQQAAQQLVQLGNRLGSDLAALEKFLVQAAAAVAQLAQQWDDAQHKAVQSALSPLTMHSRRGRKVSAGDNGAVGSGSEEYVQLTSIYEACARDVISAGLKTDAILIGLSDVYEHLRGIVPDPEATLLPPLKAPINADAATPAGVRSPPQSSNTGAAPTTNGTWVPPDEFRRKTTKFWARPCDIPAIQAEIVRHLPILIFNRRKSDHIASGGYSQALKLLAQKKASASSAVSSVYYDNPQQLSTYAGRLQRDDGAQLVRVRWYGARREGRPGATQKMWVERKTHHEPWTQLPSIKERAELEQQYVADFANGTTGLPGTIGEGRRPTLLREVQQFLRSTTQEPVIRTSCDRTAFQTTSSADLRVSIDTSLRFTRESAKVRGDAWCRSEAMPAGKGASVAFPYAVVELKVQDQNGAHPIWVRNLLESGMLLEVAAFSKFLHAMALHYPVQAARVGVPYWFLPSVGNTVTPATFEEMAASAEKASQAAESWVFPSTLVSSQPRQPRPKLAFFRSRASPHVSEAPFQDRSVPGRSNSWCFKANSATEEPLLVPTSQRSYKEVPSPVTTQANGLAMSVGTHVALPSSTAVHMQRPSSASESGGHSYPAAEQPGSSTNLSGSAPAPAATPLTATAAAATAATATIGAGTASAAVAGRFPESEQGQQAEHPVAGPTDHVTANPQHSRSQPTPVPLSQPRPQLPNTAPPSPSSAAGHTVLQPQVMGLVPSGNSEQPFVQHSRESFGVSSSRGSGSRGSVVGSHCLATVQRPNRVGEQTVAGPQQSQARLHPVNFGLGEAAMPTAAALDAIEAMEAGLPPPGRNDGAPDGDGGSTPARRWQKWRVRPFRKNGGDKGGGSRNNRARAKALVRTRVEPKTFFANERTFLSWLQISVLIMFMGLTLLGGSGSPLTGGGMAVTGTSTDRGSHIAGLIIAPVAFVFTLYALFMYRRRTSQILRRENVRYDDQRGPVMLVLLLTTALVATTVITAQSNL